MRAKLRRLLLGLWDQPGEVEADPSHSLRTQEAAAGSTVAGSHHRQQAAHPATIIEAALAQKILHGWMQNRFQTLYPLVINLRNHTDEEASLLVGIVRQALLAVAAEEAEMLRAAAWLMTVGGRMPEPGRNLSPDLVDRARESQLGPHAYALTARALGRETLTSRRFLDFLAARLGIADDMARSLNREFAS